MIESFQNDKIKYATRLITDNRFRKKSGVFAVEGKQENQRALQFQFEPTEYYICESLYNEELPKGKVHLVSEKVYEKLAYRGTSEGIIGIYNCRKLNPELLKLKDNSTIILLEGIEKPGNLGAILRSCEAFGIDALIITDTKVDVYNPNVIRSSVGCFFGMQIAQTSNADAFSFLIENGIKIHTTIMDETSVEIQTKDLTEKVAIAFGTEHSGLSEFWKNKGENILIPMSGTIDSLNLSNAVAITCYEILRQKKA